MDFLLREWPVRLGLAMALAIALSWAAPISADAFLDTIRGEVHAVEVDSASQKSLSGRATASTPAPKPEAAAPRTVKHDMPTKLSASELESYLKNNYLGTYSFYKRLTDEQKQAVYRFYRAQPQIALLREKVKQLYLQR